MGSRYRYVRAEGQEDGRLCWAACLAWWFRATDRPNLEQGAIIEDYSQLWDNGGDGTISYEGLMTIVTDVRWRMNWDIYWFASHLDKAAIRSFLATGPIYIGFYDQTISSNHVNNIYDIWGSGSNPQVAVMEPMGTMNADGSFIGKHLTRGLSYYTSQGPIILGSPKR